MLFYFFLVKHFLKILPYSAMAWPAVQSEALCSLARSSRGSLRCGRAGGSRTTRAQVRLPVLVRWLSG